MHHQSNILTTFLAISISQERLIRRVHFELLSKLLLGHVQPLMVHISLVGSCLQVRWQMVLDVDYLGHIVHSIVGSSWNATHVVSSIVLDARGKVLTLRGLALPFQTSEVHLILGVRGSANRPLVDHVVLVHLLLHVVVYVGWLGWGWLLLSIFIFFTFNVKLDVVSAGLRSPLDLILNLGSLLLIGVSNLDALADLLVV